MRRILFYSFLAFCSGAGFSAWAGDVDSNIIDYLKELRGDLYDRNSTQKREVYSNRIETLRAKIKDLRSQSRDRSAAKAKQDALDALEKEKKVSEHFKTVASFISFKINAASWKTVGNQLKARIPNSPFVMVLNKSESGEVTTSIEWAPMGVAALGEKETDDMRGTNFKDMRVDDVRATLDLINNELKRETKTLATGEAFDGNSSVAKAMVARGGPFGSGKSVEQALKDRLSDLGDRSKRNSEIGEAHSYLELAKSDSLRNSEIQELEKKMDLVGKVRDGKLNLGKTEEELCKGLIQDAGSFARLSEDVRNECKDYAPKVVEAKASDEEKETAKAEKVDKAGKAKDEELQRLVDQVMRQNMALCHALAQKSANPMSEDQQRGLANILSAINMDPKMGCQTIGLVMSSVAAENFDKAMGGGQAGMDFVSAELAKLDGMDPGTQTAFIGDKVDGVVQTFFEEPLLETASRSTARGNMREGQRIENEKTDQANRKIMAAHRKKLRDEKECLEKYAGNMFKLLQSTRALNPSSEAEAAAVHQIQIYNSVAQMLLKSVTNEISARSFADSMPIADPVVSPTRVPLRDRGQSPSSVRVVNPQRNNNSNNVGNRGGTVQQSQGGRPAGSGGSPRGIYGN